MGYADPLTGIGYGYVVREADRVWNFVRQHADPQVDPGPVELRHEAAIEGRDRHRLEVDATVNRFGRADRQAVVDKVEVDLEDAATGMDRRRAPALDPARIRQVGLMIAARQ